MQKNFFFFIFLSFFSIPVGLLILRYVKEKSIDIFFEEGPLFPRRQSKQIFYKFEFTENSTDFIIFDNFKKLESFNATETLFKEIFKENQNNSKDSEEFKKIVIDFLTSNKNFNILYDDLDNTMSIYDSSYIPTYIYFLNQNLNFEKNNIKDFFTCAHSNIIDKDPLPLEMFNILLKAVFEHSLDDFLIVLYPNKITLIYKNVRLFLLPYDYQELFIEIKKLKLFKNGFDLEKTKFIIINSDGNTIIAKILIDDIFYVLNIEETPVLNDFGLKKFIPLGKKQSDTTRKFIRNLFNEKDPTQTLEELKNVDLKKIKEYIDKLSIRKVKLKF